MFSFRKCAKRTKPEINTARTPKNINPIKNNKIDAKKITEEIIIRENFLNMIIKIN